jgi:hypothetical protein
LPLDCFAHATLAPNFTRLATNPACAPAFAARSVDREAKLPAYREPSPTLSKGSLGPGVAWLQQALAGKDIGVGFPPYTGAIDGIFGPLTDAALRGLQAWANVPVTGVADDATWFVWMTPGSAQQLTLEGACGFLNKLGA